MATNRERRGSEVVEAALTLPILLVVVAGIVDFGWFYTQQASIQQAVRQGARIGSATSQEDGPAGAAQAATEHALHESGIAVTVTVTSGFEGLSNGEQAIRVEADADYAGLWGLINLPLDYGSVAVMRMEEQP